MIHLQIEQNIIRKEDVKIDCPACKRIDSPAIAYDLQEVTKAYFVLPVWWNTFSGVKCIACEHEFALNEPAGVLCLLSKEDLSATLQPVPGTVEWFFKFVIVCSFLVFWSPVIPLLLALVGLAGTYSYKSGWRIAAIVAIVLNVLFSIFWIVVFTL